MTDIRAHGFDNPAQLHEHLADLEQEGVAEDEMTDEFQPLEQQLFDLKARMTAMRRRLALIQHQASEASSPGNRPDIHSPKIVRSQHAGLVIAAGFVLGMSVMRNLLPGSRRTVRRWT